MRCYECDFIDLSLKWLSLEKFLHDLLINESLLMRLNFSHFLSAFVLFIDLKIYFLFGFNL